ncbi:MAG: hypothetical protein V1779_10475 [bacterium]
MLSFCASQKATQEKHDNIIVGEVSWEYWKANAGWALYEAPDYEPEQKALDKLKELLKGKDYKFIVFATTYCDECEENLPKLFMLFELAQIPDNRIRLFGLDESGSEPSGEYKKYNIRTTPEVYLSVDSIIIGQAGYPYRWLQNFIEILEGYGK